MCVCFCHFIMVLCFSSLDECLALGSNPYHNPQNINSREKDISSNIKCFVPLQCYLAFMMIDLQISNKVTPRT